MSASDYIAGLLLFATMLACTLGGAELIVRSRLRHLRGAPRLLAVALLGTLGVIAVHVVPAALGLLARGSVTVAALIWLIGAAAIARTRGGNEVSTEGEPDGEAGGSPRVGRLLAALATGIVVAFGLATLGDRLTLPPQSVDLLNFHLPGVARWIETGSIWQIDVFSPTVATGHYPNNGDVLLLATVLPWHNDFLTHLSMFPFWALTGVAAYALARELGARTEAAVVSACLLLTVPAIAVPALIAGLVDIVAAFGIAVGLVFLVRHWRSGRRSDLVLGGLGLGLAFGTKWYGVAAALIVLVVWATARVVARRPTGEVARQGAALVGLVLAAGGIWMVRNWVESGNPVLPLEVSVFGHTVFGAPPDVLRAGAGFSLADYVGDTGVWGDLIWPQLRHSMAAPVAIAGLGFAVAVAALAGLGPRPRRRAVLAFAVAAAALLVIAYVVTPYSAGGPAGAPLLVADDARYAGPALAALAAVAAAGVAGRPRLAAVLGVLALAAMIDGARWSSGAAREAASLDPFTWGAVIAATLAVWLCWPRLERGLPRRPLAWAAAGAAALAVIALGGYRVQRDFNDGRYLGVEPALDYLISNAPSGTRIGLAGLWDDQGIAPVLPAFGPRLGNQVAYVGRSEQEILQRYTDEAAFDAALDRGDYDYLIVGLGRPDDPHVPEEGWAQRAGWRQVVASGRLALLRPPPT